MFYTNTCCTTYFRCVFSRDLTLKKPLLSRVYSLDIQKRKRNIAFNEKVC